MLAYRLWKAAYAIKRDDVNFSSSRLTQSRGHARAAQRRCTAFQCKVKYIGSNAQQPLISSLARRHAFWGSLVETMKKADRISSRCVFISLYLSRALHGVRSK